MPIEVSRAIRGEQCPAWAVESVHGPPTEKATGQEGQAAELNPLRQHMGPLVQRQVGIEQMRIDAGSAGRCGPRDKSALSLSLRVPQAGVSHAPPEGQTAQDDGAIQTPHQKGP